VDIGNLGGGIELEIEKAKMVLRKTGLGGY